MKLLPSLKIVSYNILAQPWLSYERNPYVADFEKCTQWSYRWILLQKQFIKLSGDVICLQEVEQKSYEEDLLPFFNRLGYKGTMQRKWIGNAVFYRENMFQLHSIVERSRTIIVTLLNKGKAGQRSSTEEESLLTVANVHLEGDPYRPQEKFFQIRSLFKYLQRNIEKTGEKSVMDQHVVICGDFNCSDDCGIYKLLTTGKLTQEDKDPVTNTPYTQQEFTHPYHMKSAYKQKTGSEPEFTFYVATMKAEPLDFMFYSFNNIKVLEVEDPTADKEQYLSTYLPNAHHPSDHLPLAVVMELL